MPTQLDATEKVLTFSDFSKGIVQKTGILGALTNSPAQLGAASIQNTYRCIALPGGGLGPLPKKVRDLTHPSLVAGLQYNTVGMLVFGPVYHTANSPVVFPPFEGATPFEMHVGVEWDEAGTHHFIWRRYRYFSDNGFDDLKTLTSANLGKFSPLYLTADRANPLLPTLAGYPIVVGSWVAVEDPAVTASFVSAFPDPAASTVTGVFDYGISSGGKVIGHQNRIVAFVRTMSNHGGAGTDYVPFDEFVTYTLPNDTAIDASNQAFGEEFPVGYGCIGSMDSSDLLLIKHFGGAYLVQGGINDPLVRRLPGVVGTAGVECVGTSTPIGFVYLVNKDGVYAWQGGDGSVLLSPQLEDNFWDAGAAPYLFKGSFTSWGNWILVPNNFVFDTMTESWWRIEDPTVATYFLYQRDPINNVLYAGRTFAKNELGSIYASGYDRATPATNFSWQSQPFGLLPRRNMSITQVYVRAQGAGTVTITFTADGSVDANPAVLTFTTATPTILVSNCNITGTQVVMRIVSDGGASAAPVILEVNLVYNDGQELAVA